VTPLEPRDVGRAYDHSTAVAAWRAEQEQADDLDACWCGYPRCAGQCDEPADTEPLFTFEEAS